MDKTFLEGLGLDESQCAAILGHEKEEFAALKLKAAGARSVAAAMGALGDLPEDSAELDSAVQALKNTHPYLFTEDAPLFAGPAGGAAEDPAECALRKALGID